MSLLLPQMGFRRQVDNLDVSLSGFPPATTVASGATSHVIGDPVTLLPALAFDVHYVCINIANTAINGSTSRFLVDILVDPAGGTSWSVLIPTLAGGQATPAGGHNYVFPLYIPAGTSIGAQSQALRATPNPGIVTISCFGEPIRPDMWWCGTGVESLGLFPATSNGTDVTAGNTVFGSWTNVGSPTTYDYGSLQVGCNGGGATMTARRWILEFGAAGIALPVGRIALTSSTAEGTTYAYAQTPFCSIPAGTQLQCRAADSGGVMDLNVALYGVY